MDDRSFSLLLDCLGLSWKGYRKVRKGVKRRLGRRLAALGCKDLRAYLERLERSGEERRRCERLMTVSISRFFRDACMWRVLREEILPAALEIWPGRLAVWSAGCASGEEVYSFRIVWKRFAATFPRAPELRLLATDLNPLYLERAKRGVYPESVLREVSERVRSDCFKAKGEGLYAVVPSLKEGIVWKAHDFLSGPPADAPFHLLFLRNNLFTYYDPPLVEKGVERVKACLSPGGFLILGAHEKLPPGTTGFSPFGLPCVLRRKGSVGEKAAADGLPFERQEKNYM